MRAIDVIRSLVVFTNAQRCQCRQTKFLEVFTRVSQDFLFEFLDIFTWVSRGFYWSFLKSLLEFLDVLLQFLEVFTGVSSCFYLSFSSFLMEFLEVFTGISRGFYWSLPRFYWSFWRFYWRTNNAPRNQCSVIQHIKCGQTKFPEPCSRCTLPHRLNLFIIVQVAFSSRFVFEVKKK